MKCFVCHYGEVALKGKNRRFFEKRLVFNIKEVFPGAKISNPRGRIVLIGEEEGMDEKLRKIPGIEYFFIANVVPSSLEKIKERTVSLMEKADFENFRITVKRADKSFPVSSQDLSVILGEEVRKKTGKKVDLKSPDKNCFLEITLKETYIYFEKIKGVGGLPVGTGGKAVSLLSGGIDSPVASFRMIKRGMKNVFLHFHAYPATSKQSIDKTKRIVKTLSSFQGKSTLYLVPFNEIQKEIMIGTSEKMRVLLYRRFMMRIGEEIAKKEKAKAIVTGESLGQVASQTVENLTVTEEVLSIPVFRPLIGHNKEEIVSEAKEIETYNISILPEEDCCVRFLPKSPETKGKIADAKKEEENLEVERITREALEKTEKVLI